MSRIRICIAATVLILNFCSIASVFADPILLNESAEMIALVEVRNDSHLALIRSQNFEIEEIRSSSARVRLPARDYSKLESLGLSFEIIIDDLRSYHFRNAKNGCDPCGDWRDPDWMIEQAMNCQEDHPDICMVVDIGESVSGQRIVAVKVSDTVGVNENEVEVLFEGSIHGDEVVGGELNVYLMNYLTDNFGVVPEVNYLIEEREIWFAFPTNPDGLCACSRYNDNLVDLNRDSGFAWRGLGASTAPFSQPETRALYSFITDHTFAFQTSWHGGALAFLFPWSYLGDIPYDLAEFEYIGGDYAAIHLNIAELTQGYDFYGYGYAGTTKDSAYGSFGALAWTIELSEVKAPNFSAEYDYLMNSNLDAALRLIQLAGDQGVRGVITDDTTGEPLAALVEIDGKMITYTDPDVGDLHRFVLPGVYDMAIKANGYLSKMFEGIEVPAGGTVDISTTMEKADVPTIFAQRLLYNFSSADTQTEDQGFFVLGPPDGRSYPLGTREDLPGIGPIDSYMVLDLGEPGILDGPSSDIAIYDGNSLESEFYTIYISAGDSFGPWIVLGEGEGSAAFDLASIDATFARYIKIEHRAAEAFRDGDGLEIDAVGSVVNGADFQADVVSGAVPLDVHFTDQSLTAPVAWQWDFGDGQSSTERDPMHIYTQAGIYSVTLTIETPFGEQSIERQNYIQVFDAPPAAHFDADVKSGYPPLQVQFQNFSTGEVTGFEWDLGDGSVSSEENPIHAYESAGIYSVSLTVTGPGGSDNSQWANMINVHCPPPEADFQYSPSSGKVPLMVTFEGDTPTSPGCEGDFVWDFGDGQSGEGSIVVHNYTEPGLYSVELVVETPGGSDQVYKNNIIHAGIEESDDDSESQDGSTIMSTPPEPCSSCDDDDENGGCGGW